MPDRYLIVGTADYTPRLPLPPRCVATRWDGWTGVVAILSGGNPDLLDANVTVLSEHDSWLTAITELSLNRP